jgi:hypothetical protein
MLQIFRKLNSPEQFMFNSADSISGTGESHA